MHLFRFIVLNFRFGTMQTKYKTSTWPVWSNTGKFIMTVRLIKSVHRSCLIRKLSQPLKILITTWAGYEPYN